MRTKMFNILVVVATVVTLLPLAAFGGVASAQQVGPVGNAVVGEAQGLPLCSTIIPTAALTPAMATNAAATTHTVSLTGFDTLPVTATWTVEGFPSTPQILTQTATNITIKMDTPGTAYITAVVNGVCYLQAKKHYAEVTDISVSPANTRRQMVWNEGLKRFVTQPVTITATVLGEYPVKFGDADNAPEAEGTPAPGGGFYHWNGNLLKVIDAPVANATVTFALTSPCLAVGPANILVDPTGRNGTLLPTNASGKTSIAVSSEVKGTCSVTLTAGTSNPDLGRVSGTVFVTFFDLEAEKTPQVRWAGEEIVLEKWFGTELAGFLVNFYLQQQSPGCLVSITGSCDSVFSVIDSFGYARVMYSNEDQGEVDVEATVLGFAPAASQIIKANGFSYVQPSEVPFGLGILNKHAFLVWYLKLEDVALGNVVLPTAAQIETALGRPAGSLTPNQVAALIAIITGAPNTMNAPTNQNAGIFSGTPGTSTSDGANGYEPGPGLGSEIQAITGVKPTEAQTAAFAQIFNALFNVNQPSPLVGGAVPGTVTSESPFVTNRQLLQTQVRGWFTGENMCVNPERTIDDGNRLEILPRGRCILPDDWPVLAGRIDWKQTRPTYDLMDNPGDQVKSGPVDLFSAIPPGNANFPFNKLGAFYQYGTPTAFPVVQPVTSLVAAYPVIGPNSSLDQAYLSPGFVFDPRISLAPRSETGLPLLPPSCDDVNDSVASGLCTVVTPGVGAHGQGPLVAPSSTGVPGGGPALIYLDGSGTHFFARKTHVPNGILDWYDAPMPPAKIIFESLGPTTGDFIATDKGNIFRVRDLIGFDAAGARAYAWRTTSPFYQVMIPASGDIPPIVNNGGYDWDSWGVIGTAPRGGYDFWTIVDRPFANKAVVYSDNNGRAMIFLSSGDLFDLSRFRNQQGGFDIPAGAVVGSTTVRAVADYPYFRKHPPALSNNVTKNWVSQFSKVLTASPRDQKLQITATITDVHGTCPTAEEIRWFIEGPPGFTGTIVSTSEGTSGLLTQTTAVTFGLTNCQAFIWVENLSAGARVKAFFADELLERFYPETVSGTAKSLSSQIHFSANVGVAGGPSLGGVAGDAVVTSAEYRQTVSVPWTSVVGGQTFNGTLTAMVGASGSDFSVQIVSVSGRLGNVSATIPITNGNVWIVGGNGSKDYSFSGTGNVEGVGNVTINVAGTVSAQAK
jgi:hypothetical protein